MEPLIDVFAEGGGQVEDVGRIGDAEPLVAEGGGEVVVAGGMGEAGEQEDAVGEALIVAGLFQSGQGGLGGGGGDGIVGDQSDDAAPGCGVGERADALGAHAVALCQLRLASGGRRDNLASYPELRADARVYSQKGERFTRLRPAGPSSGSTVSVALANRGRPRWAGDRGG